MARKKVESNFSKNMKSVGVKTIGVFLGVPHFVLSYTAYEIAKTEGLLCSLVTGKSRGFYENKRNATTKEVIFKIEDKIDEIQQGAVYYASVGTQKVQNLFTKKHQEA